MMTDELDVEAMLEAPYRKEDDGSRKSSDRKDKRDRNKDRKKDKRRSRDRKDRGDRKDRAKDRDREKDREPKDKDKDRDQDRDKDRRRKSRSRDRDSRRSRRNGSPDRGDRNRRRSKSPYIPAWKKRKSLSPPSKSESSEMFGAMTLNRTNLPELTPEERDARTVFCMQLAPNIRPRDIEDFFSSVGKVNDVRIITDNTTRRSKGIAYIEFAECETVPLALGLNGQKLKGKPIMVLASQAEKNRTGNPIPSIPGMNHKGPMRLYVGSLHFNITEEMLQGIFAPFGKIDHINLVLDSDGRSKGFGFVTFETAEDAKRALEQLNGFELAGRPMKVGHVTERTADMQGGGGFDCDEMDRAGIDLGATGRLALMAKLAEGTGFEIPPVAANALSMTQGADSMSNQNNLAPPIATQCFMLSNMFDPTTEQSPKWDQEIKDDVIDECNKHGGVLHIFVDKNSPTGNVYVKCPTISAAVASVQALHGRFFAGKVITAAYVPLPNYHQLFAESQTSRTLLMSSTQQQAQLQYVAQYGAAAGMMGAMQHGMFP